jgi:hypothetical protein
MEDEISFGRCGVPHLLIKSGTCKRCGEPVANVGDVCAACMSRAWRAEAMQRQKGALRNYPGLSLEIRMDDKMVTHAMLIGYPGWTFCMLRPKEPGRKRDRMTAFPAKLPAGICMECRRYVEEARKGEYVEEARKGD